MMDSYIRLYTNEDRQEVLSLKLRAVDRKEVLHTSGKPIRTALKAMCDGIPELFVIVHKEKIEGVLGVTDSAESGEGIPFLLVTDAFKGFKFHLAKYGQSVIDMFLAKYPVLTNYVAKENKETIKWLKSLGAAISIQDYYFRYNPYYPFKRFIFLAKEQEGDKDV